MKSTLVILALSLFLINCTDSPNPFNKDESTVRIASVDGVKYLTPGVEDPENKNMFLQNHYSVERNGRLLLRYESVANHSEDIIVEQPLLLRLELYNSTDESTLEKARTNLKVCPIMQNWMMGATWWRAHPFFGGEWQPGGEVDWDGCVAAASLENPPEEDPEQPKPDEPGSHEGLSSSKPGEKGALSSARPGETGFSEGLSSSKPGETGSSDDASSLNSGEFETSNGRTVEDKDKNKDKEKKHLRYSKDEWDFCDKSKYLCFELNNWYQLYFQDKGENFGFVLVNEKGGTIKIKGDAYRSGGPTLYWRKFWQDRGFNDESTSSWD